jgi:3'-5' exoribonuclease
MIRRYVKDLTSGDTVDEVFLVADKQLRANRNGNLYLQIELRDRTGTVSSRMWNATEALFHSFEPNDFLRVRGKAQLFQGAMQLILSDLEVVEADRVQVADFLPHTAQDVDRLLARLREILQSMTNPHLRALVEVFLMDEHFVRKFAAAPAGIKNHHAYVGGLLEHVVNLLEAASRIAPLYPQIDRDVLLAGVFLHDLGKIDELCYEKAFAYSDEGQLVGHLVIGVEYLNRKVAEAATLTGDPFPTELLLRLKHMILSHHGSYEFGSPKLPMTLEAVALNLLDNLDAKIASLHDQIRDDRDPSSAWTQYNPSIGRKLYKGTGNGSRGGDGGIEDRG